MNDRVAVNPGATGVLLPTVTGAGYIDHLWACGNDSTNVQVTVDGESSPSINLPIRFLTGGFYSNDGQGPFAGRFITANGDPGVPVLCGSMNLPIPFGTSIAVGLHNNSSSTFYTASMVSYETGVSNNWPRTQRLHIDWGCDNSSSADPDCVGGGLLSAYGTQVLCCSVTGKEGRFVGFSWLYDGYPGNASPPTAPLEGNFEFYVDGASTPTYASSGAEDLFEMSFYFDQFSAPFVGNPDIGLTWKNDYTFGAWRFYIQDPILFNNSLTMQWHCGQSGEPVGVTLTGSCAVYWSAYYYTVE
jgi:hypothetical protein